MDRSHAALNRLWLWLAPLAFLGVFFFYPLGRVLLVSFARPDAGLEGFLRALTAPRTLEVLGFTAGQALLSTLLTLLAGLPGAYLFARYQFRGKALLRALTAIPFVMPTLATAAAFQALLGPRGWLNAALMALLGLDRPPLALTGGLGAILLAHVFYNTTIILRAVGDFWSHLDPRLAQAARTLGATRWQAFYRVTLPLLAPAILSAALLVFLFDFTSFGVILALGGPRFATLEVEIYYQTTALFDLPAAATLALLQLACTLAISLAYTRWSARLARPLSLRPQTFNQRRLSSPRARWAAAAIFTLLFVLLLLPLFALAARSLTQLDAPAGQFPALTLDYYRELSVDRRQSIFYAPPATAIAVSLGYAAATAALSLALGLPAAWALAGERAAPLDRWLDPLLMLPMGASAVTMGLGLILALDRPPLDLRASPLLIPIAHTLAAFPLVVRSLTPALRSIRPRLRQAAAVLGATPRQAFARVTLPLAGRAVLTAATFAFTISLGEFGATALIARPEYPTVPVAIFRLLARPGALNYGQALALATILMAVCAAGMLLIERLRFGAIGEF